MSNKVGPPGEPGGRKEWASGMHGRIAATLAQAREAAGWSTNQLATETAALGCPVSRSQIARYENGQKLGLDVTELLALAAALRIPPIALMFGGHPDAEVEVLPGDVRSNAEAIGWFSGDPSLSGSAGVESDSPLSVVLRLTRERAEMLATVADLQRRLASPTEWGEKVREMNLRGVANVTEDIATVDAAISATLEAQK
ncbi:helix-turn-helix domain-containing protein [Mycolicibacterium fluoranthenivorans]|nr:helix-turn-helix domain-containing protein [Mycolicibacterium fluoranthenivorans]